LRQRSASTRSILKRVALAQPATAALEERCQRVRVGEHRQRKNAELGNVLDLRCEDIAAALV
jgi:hypothetical protein